MKEDQNDWDLQPEDVPLNPAHVAQAAKATGQDKAAKTAEPIKAPPQAAAPTQATAQPQRKEQAKLPYNVAELLELLQEGEAELAKIPSNQRVQRNQHFIYVASELNRIKAKFHALQQGLPVVDITADHQAKSQKLRDEINAREIWEMRARADYHVANLLAAYDDLKAQVAQLTKDLEAATEPKQ
jgi:hypothetical protein